MKRRVRSLTSFEAVTIEGGLLGAEWLAKVAALDAAQQHPGDYGVPKGLNLRDEIARAWRVSQAAWEDFETSRREGASALHAAEMLTRRLLQDVLGFADLVEAPATDEGFPIRWVARGGAVPVVVAPHGVSLDTAQAEFGAEGRKRSPHGLLQECLNAHESQRWGIATNGLEWRLVRDHLALTRPAWVGIDLERIFLEERFSDFSLWWLLSHASRFGHSGAPEGLLETWRGDSLAQGLRARDTMRRGVKLALECLGTGFLSHPANKALRDDLSGGRMTAGDFYQPLLRLVYRLIFLWTVEERDLLHAPDVPPEARDLYARGYRVGRLVARSVSRSAYDAHGDLWQGIGVVFRSLESGQPLLGLPALGGLFASEQGELLAGMQLRNRDLLAAVRHLAWLQDGESLSRVNWKDMGAEELGSIYEGLLELVPEIQEGGRTFGFASAGDSRGNARKLTGSYYTPDSLVQQVLDNALDPVVEARLAARPGEAEAAILSLKVIDPACGSGHFLLGAARRLAGHLARARAGNVPPTPLDFQVALRDVVSRCIHGVDLNPMAIELARMALWLEAIVPNKPLTFLEHHLVCGDALVGLMRVNEMLPQVSREGGIPDEAFACLTGDDKAVASALKKRNKEGRRELPNIKGQLTTGLGQGEHIARLRALDEMPDDTPERLLAKREALTALRANGEESLDLAMDLYVAAFLMPKDASNEALVPTNHEWIALLTGKAYPGDGRDACREAARKACEEARVLHWPRVFGHVLDHGGFDVVVGNPPWERIKLLEEEFFASRHVAIANAPNKAARQKLIAGLEAATEGSPEKALYHEFVEASHRAEAQSTWCHHPTRYPLTGKGDVNTYALFAETAMALTSETGRAGILVPSGIASDNATSAFFAHLSEGRLVRLIDYENRDGIFPGVHRSFKFCVLAMGRSPSATFSFYLTDTTQATDERRSFQLTPEEFARLNPNTKTCPVFRSAADAELTKRIYMRVPVLWDESRHDGNPWKIQKGNRLFDMSTDSELFRTQSDRHTLKDPVALYEGKMVHHFDHRWATCEPDGEFRDLSDAEKGNSAVTITPRYWIERAEVEGKPTAKGWSRGWLIGWRDICRATDERTLIAGIIPRVGVGNTLPLMLPAGEVSASLLAVLAANLASLCLDFVCRQKIGGTHLNFFYVKQFPVLPPKAYTPADLGFLVPRILELTYTAYDLEPFYQDLIAEDPAFDPRPGASLGMPFAWDPDRRRQLRAELDAWFAHAYGLNRDDLRFILDPAEVLGADYPTETFRGMKNNEIERFGEYRTQRLILEAWDRYYGGENSVGAMGLTQGARV